MKKLLIYHIKNSYKFVIIALITSTISYMIKLFIYKNFLTDFINILLSAVLIVQCIMEFTNEIGNGNAVLLYSTPNSTTTIFGAKIITSFIWVAILNIWFAVFNIIVKYIPFTGYDSYNNEYNWLSNEQSFILRNFSLFWCITFMMALILICMLVYIINNVLFSNKHLKFILSAALYIIVFYIYLVLLIKTMEWIPINYILGNKNYIMYGYTNLKYEMSILPSNNATLFASCKGNITLGATGILYNIVLIAAAFIASASLLKHKIEF